MEPKKNPRMDIDKRRAVHIQIGLIISLSFALVSLEWSNREEGAVPANYNFPDEIAVIDILLPIIRDEKPKVKPIEKLPSVLVPIPMEDGYLGPVTEIETIFEPVVKGPYKWFPQDIPEEPICREPFEDYEVNVKPEYPGGEGALMEWLYGQIVYPDLCIEHGIEGKVLAKFTISSDGSVTNIEIIRKVDPLLDAEVIRVLELLPDFKPAIKNGKYVPVNIRIPVNFDLK